MFELNKGGSFSGVASRVASKFPHSNFPLLLLSLEVPSFINQPNDQTLIVTVAKLIYNLAHMSETAHTVRLCPST